MLALGLCLAIAAELSAALELRAGPAWVASERGVTLHVGAGERTELGARGFLATGSLARARLSLGAAACIDVDGRAAVQWSPAPAERCGIDLALSDAGEVEISVRRGPVWLALPGGWFAHLERGAFAVRGLSGGRTELESRAGEPVLLRSASLDGFVRPPATLLAGARVVLAPSASSPRATRGTVQRLLAPRRPTPRLERRGSVPAGEAWISRRWPFGAPAAAVAGR